MSVLKTTAGALALGLTLIATASPGLAREHASQNWRNARAEAIGGVPPGGRAMALRNCNTQVNKKKEYTWGEQTDSQYRACMSKRGQPE